MFTLRRSTAALLALAVLIGWFAWLRPTALGGPATFVMVSGDSMEPTYSNGDLVILHRSRNYETGDIVAYPMKTYFDTGRLVIHRVVGSEGERFITQGDNRETADPWRPTADDIRGTAWVSVPKLGIYAAWLRQPNHLGAFAAGILLTGGIGGAGKRRRWRHGMKQHHARPNGEPGRNGGGFRPALVGLTATAAVLAALFLGVVVLAFRTDAHSGRSVSEPTYAETGTYSYEIQMEPSTLYPDGLVSSPPLVQADSPVAPQPPRPAFSALVRDARVKFDYELDSTAPADLFGTISADLVIRATGGEWSRTTPLLAPEPFDGTATSRSVTVDLRAAKALIARVEEETGLRGGPYEIVVLMRIDGHGTYLGDPFETSFEAPFALTYNNALITPPAELTTQARASTTTTLTEPRTLSMGFWAPSVSLVRGLTVTGFATAVVVSIGLGAVLALSLWNDENARIRARYGSQLVDVQTGDTAAEESIGVASIRDLARLAERFGSVILHQPLPNGHRYFVRDGEDTYEFVLTGNESEVAQPRSAADPAGS
jgi:signal peptidase I